MFSESDSPVQTFARPFPFETEIAEFEAAENRRAMLESAADTFDPSGLYALEQEADLAASLLAETFKGHDVTLSVTENRHHIAGRWQNQKTWIAIIFAAPFDVHAAGDTPTQAVENAMQAHRRANAPVREHPEHSQLVASTFEAFGRIDPATAAEFLKRVESHHGCSDFLTVDSDGRVLLAKGSVGPEEAFAIGGYVADHLSAGTLFTPKIVIERSGEFFVGFVVMPSGERVRVAGKCVSEADARALAQAAAAGLRSTVTAPATVAPSAAA